MPLTAHGSPSAYFTFSSLTAVGVPHVTTTRHCPGMGPSSGTRLPFGSAVVETMAPAGLDLERAAWARQVHGADVARVEGGGFAGIADVLVTTSRRLPLAIFTADCLAIILVDVEAPALAVAHVGWRGTVRGAAQAAVAAVIAVGAHAERLRVAISPSIGPCCYEVDAPVVEAFTEAYAERSLPWLTQTDKTGHWFLDLWAANTSLLERTGIDPARVESPRVCTACQTDTFYSYRRSNRGRLATVAALP